MGCLDQLPDSCCQVALEPSWIYRLRPLQEPSQGGEWEEGEGVDAGISCQTLSFIGVETEKVVSWSRRLVIPEF